MLLVNVRLRDSRWGRAWIALRDDEAAAACRGVPIVRTKLLAYGVGAALGGVVRRLPGVVPEHRQPDQFTFSFSIFILAMVVLGGLGSIWGVVVGAIVLSAINNYLLPKVLYDVPSQLGLDFDLSQIASGIYGLLLVVMMLLRPQGLLPGADSAKDPRMATDAHRAGRLRLRRAYFHAPLLAAAAGVEFAGVVTRSPERRAEVERDRPGPGVRRARRARRGGRGGRGDLDARRDAHPARAGGDRARPRGRGRQAVRARRRAGAHRGRGRRGGGRRAERLPEPALGLGPADRPAAARQRRAGRGDAVRVGVRALLGRPGAGGRRRHPARLRQPPDRPGAAAVRPGRDRVRRRRRARRALLRRARAPGRHDLAHLGRLAPGRARAALPRARQRGQLRRVRHGRPGGRADRRPHARDRGDAGGASRRSAGAACSAATSSEPVPSERGRWDTYYPAFAAAVRGEGPCPSTRATRSPA